MLQIDINIPYSMEKIPMLYGIFISIIFLVNMNTESYMVFGTVVICHTVKL